MHNAPTSQRKRISRQDTQTDIYLPLSMAAMKVAAASLELVLELLPTCSPAPDAQTSYDE